MVKTSVSLCNCNRLESVRLSQTVSLRGLCRPHSWWVTTAAEELQLFEMHQVLQPYPQVPMENLLLSDEAVKHGWGQDPPQHGQVLCPCRRQSRKKTVWLMNSAQHMFSFFKISLLYWGLPSGMREATANKKVRNGVIQFWEWSHRGLIYNLKHQWNHVFGLWLEQGQKVVQRHSLSVIIIFLVSITIL